MAETETSDVWLTFACNPSLQRGTLYLESVRPPTRISNTLPPLKRPSLGTAGIVTLVVIGFAVISAFAASIVMPFTKHGRKNSALAAGLCDTTACTSYAGMLSDSISNSRNPCSNFYRFVCDGYANSSRSVFKEHMVTFTAAVARTLRTAEVPGYRQSAFEKAAKFYQSCMAVVNGANEMEQFRKIMTKAGIEWPRMSETPNLLLSLAGMSVALDIYTILVLASVYTNRRLTFEIGKGNLLEQLKHRRKSIESLGRYEPYYDSFCQIFIGSAGNIRGYLRFDEFLRIENKVFHYLTGRKKSGKVFYENFYQLHKLTPTIQPQRWMEMLSIVRDGRSNTSFRVLVRDMQYLRAFDDLLNDIGEPSLHFYYGWTVVQSLARYMSEGLAILSYGNRKTAKEESPINCLRVIEATMGLTVYAQYATAEFGPDIKMEVTQLIEHVFSALMRVMQANPSLDIRETSMDLRKLVDALLPRFQLLENESRLNAIFNGVPDMGWSFANNWILVQRELCKMKPTTRASVHSSYLANIGSSNYYAVREPATGELGLAPYITLLPLYDFQAVKSVKYGALGTLIAVATFEFFYERLPRDSKFRSLLWQRTKCYEAAGVLHGLAMDPRKKLAFERAATHAILWQAFKLPSSPHTKRRFRTSIKGFAKFNEDQLFYISTCYPTCSGVAWKDAEMRCNEPLRHSRNFPGTFGCQDGSPMNPRLKCTIFY